MPPSAPQFGPGIFMTLCALALIVGTTWEFRRRVLARRLATGPDTGPAWSSIMTFQIAMGTLALILGICTDLVPALWGWAAFLGLAPIVVLVVFVVRTFTHPD